jgi:protease-4
MPVRPSLAAAFAIGLLAMSGVAAAQTANLEDVGPRLPGVAVPNASAAGGEEPAALSANAAAPGFVAGPSFQYFHEGRTTGGWIADAAFLTLPLGGLVPTLALDWIRPGDDPRFRRTVLGAALSDHRTFSLGGAWTWVHSPDPELDRVESYSLGLTVRPSRWLSLAAAADGLGARLAGERLDVRWDVGAAVRTWRDRLTLSADLLASDRGTGAGDFDPRALAFGAHAEVAAGLVLSGQVQAPLQSGSDAVGLVALGWNARHTGAVAGGAVDDARGARWLAGVRASAEAYRAAPPLRARAAHVDLEEELTERRPFPFAAPRDRFGALLARVRQLRDEPGVGGVSVTVDDLPLGLARTGELRAALAELARRKPVVAYLRGGRLAAYWLASAATAIHAPPAAVVDVAGLSSTTPFLRDGLARIGVAFDVVAAGRYKTAPDPLVRQEMSDAQREAQDSLLDGLFGRIVADVAASRRIPEARVRELVDVGLFVSADAQAAGLLDGIAWPDELERLVSDRAGRELAGGGGRPARPREAQRWGERPVVALVPIEGTIVGGKSRGAPIGGRLAGADSIGEQIRRAVDDDRVKALVLRIDSAGGDALASDLLWREVVRARQRGKPVVASLGDVAASGGYLVAVGADAIVAEPATVTGSIGVFALKPDLSGLLGKVGVNVVTNRRGARADLHSPARGWTADERALVERHVQAFYEGFKARVAEGRRMSPADVESAAAGRAWTGAQAKERRLVDELGSLEDAVALARERAGIAAGDEEVERFEAPRGVFETLSRLVGSGEPALARVARAFPEVGAALLLVEMDDLVALPPEWLGEAQPPDPR